MAEVYMKISELGLWIIKSFEKCVLVPYLDAAKPLRKWTIGWGHLLPFDEHTERAVVVAWLHQQGFTDAEGRMTQDTADRVLREDVGKAEKAVEALVTRDEEIRGNRFDALVSLVFNVGATAFARSNHLKQINAGQWAAAQDNFHTWKKSGGEVLDGLIYRRAVEAFLFGLPVQFVPAFSWTVSASPVSPDALREAASAGPGAVLVVLHPVNG
jgi:lysozyme